jgi:hypothetical protein
VTGALFDVVTVHCFFGWCGHVVSDTDPKAAHQRMEAHYAGRHDRDLTRLGY